MGEFKSPCTDILPRVTLSPGSPGTRTATRTITKTAMGTSDIFVTQTGEFPKNRQITTSEADADVSSSSHRDSSFTTDPNIYTHDYGHLILLFYCRSNGDGHR